MVLESTMICVDNSDFMRNGDFIPTRMQAQLDAVNVICHSKTRSNPENNIGLLTMAKQTKVLNTLTTESGRILATLHQVQPDGNINFISAVRVAHLALKHRLSRNHRMRIVVFVGSPINDDPKEITKLGKKLKKEKVNVDIVNFGEESVNTDKLTTFVNTINGKEGTGCHLVTVPAGTMLSNALANSPIVVGEDGTGSVPGAMQGFEFGVDPNEDPELALALRVSMEEQRARQEEEARKVQKETAPEVPITEEVKATSSEDALLKQALEMSMAGGADEEEPEAKAATVASTVPDFATMTEEEQIAYAMQMSLANEAEEEMETDDANKKKEEAMDQDEDYSEVMNDPAFLESVLAGLPGVDPQSEAIRSAMGSLSEGKDKKGDQSNKPKKQDDDKK